jgi:hypothetical protein
MPFRKIAALAGEDVIEIFPTAPAEAGSSTSATRRQTRKCGGFIAFDP